MITADTYHLLLQAFIDLNNNGFSSPKDSLATMQKQAKALMAGHYGPAFTEYEFWVNNYHNLVLYCGWDLNMLQKAIAHIENIKAVNSCNEPGDEGEIKIIDVTKACGCPYNCIH
jgi:hypothetical protein